MESKERDRDREGDIDRGGSSKSCDNEILLKPGELTLQQMREIVRNKDSKMKLDESCHPNIKAATACVERVLDEKRTVYGINTGFGLLANTKIDHAELEKLQRLIVLSHASGVGEPMSESTVRLIIALKINSLSRGFSGVRLEVIELLIDLFNNKIYPVIPEKGSVGASGDLAPLAHLAVVLIGEGQAFFKGKIVSGAEALASANLEPIKLGPKEGLALLNGTQVSTALTLEGLFKTEDMFIAGCVIGAMSVEAALGSHSPFDERVHIIRGQKGQIDTARFFRHLLVGSSLNESHAICPKVQDPYSLRCQPQVMGACLSQIRYVAEILKVEANGVTDNPLVFPEDNDIISGGNFHAEPVALVADNLALAIAEIGAISERRIALLIDSNLSQLPAFLVDNGGLNSGFMMAQVTAASLASENKSLAHPASVDSIPTSANQEDHVSMATFAGRRLREMANNTNYILGVELLAAAQGIDFRAPREKKSSKCIEEAKRLLREKVPFYDEDRYFAPDIETASKLIQDETFNGFCQCESLNLPSL